MLPSAAERLIAAGALASYSRCVLSAEAEQGSIGFSGDTINLDPRHGPLVNLLGAVVNLVVFTGMSSHFVETEVVPWVRLW